MRTYNYAYNSNIFLDRCDACEVVWVDAREFTQLLTYVKGNPKVDRLAAAMADHVEDAVVATETAERAKWNARARQVLNVPRFYNVAPLAMEVLNRHFRQWRLWYIGGLLVLLAGSSLYLLFQFFLRD